MNKVKVFLICLSVLVVVFSMLVCMEIYALERAIARGFYTDILDDMQDIGFLENGLADYYRSKMEELGWEAVEGDFFLGTWPLSETLRARKENNELVSLTVRIRPSRVSQWIHLFREGDTVFQFSGSRPSEYFDPRW
jgi:hypothetical protein